MPMAPQVDTLLDNALGPKGWYGVITVLNHTDHGDHANANNIVASAQERGVPVVSSAQMLDWLDGRNASSFKDVAYSGGQPHLLGRHEPEGPRARGDAAGAVGLRTAVRPDPGRPARDARARAPSRAWTTSSSRPSAATTWPPTRTTTAAPAISNVTATADADGHATVTWETDEPSSSRVDYGRTTALGSQVSDSARVTDHRIELTGLSPNTTYRFRVSSVGRGGQLRELPGRRPGARHASRRRPAPSWTTGPPSSAPARSSSTYSGQTVAGSDGEVQLQPTVGEEFEGTALPAGWRFAPGASEAAPTRCRRRARASTERPPTRRRSTTGPRVIEFSAMFRPVNDEAVGFGDDLSDFPLRGVRHRRRGHALPACTRRAAAPRAGEQAHAAARREPQLPAPVPDRVERHERPVLRGRRARGHAHGDHRPPHAPGGQRLRPLRAPACRCYWLRQGGYASRGTFSSRTLDAGPGAAQWQTLTGAGRASQRRPDRLRHPLRRHPVARRQLVRMAARGRRRRRSPARPRATSSTAPGWRAPPACRRRR